MADIEVTTASVETAIDDADELYFNDVSEAPDAINRITAANFFGTALAALRSAFTAASASAAASLAFAEDTDNGTNKITVTAPASIASDKTLTLPDATDTLVGLATTDTLTNKTLSGATLSGVLDAGGATSFEIPNSAAPTVDADGEIALDTSVADFSHGIPKIYGGEELAFVVLPIAELTTPTGGHVIAYNATNDEFELVAASGGVGGSTGATDNRVLRSDGTGGATVQSSVVSIDDSGNLEASGASISSYMMMCDQGGAGGFRSYSTGDWIKFPAAGRIKFIANSGTAGVALEMTEMTAPAAPSANGVYIYAEDNGSGKTRLMALFNTGAAQQIAIEP